MLQGNKLLTSMEDTREKRILIPSQDSFEALGNSTEKVQSQEEKYSNSCLSANVPKTAIGKC